MIFKRSIFENHRILAREVAKYCRVKVGPPEKIAEKYQEALQDLRDHLEENGLRMPAPIYPYIEDNMRTHRFIQGDGKCARVNPFYIYKDTWKINDAIVEF